LEALKVASGSDIEPIRILCLLQLGQIYSVTESIEARKMYEGAMSRASKARFTGLVAAAQSNLTLLS
jgi:hypothetical protein